MFEFTVSSSTITEVFTSSKHHFVFLQVCWVSQWSKIQDKFFVILQLLCLNLYIYIYFILSKFGISHKIIGFALLYFIHRWLICLLFIFTRITSLAPWKIWVKCNSTPDSKVNGANMGPTCVLSAPEGPHVGPMNLAIRDLTDTPSIRGSMNKNICMVIFFLLSYHYSWWMKHLA